MVSREQSTSNHRLLSKNADSFDHSSSLKSPRRIIGHEHNPRVECLPELLEELDGTVNKSKPNTIVSLNKYPRKRSPRWRTLASETDESGDGRSNECREKVAAFRRIENVNVYNGHEDFNTYRSREGNFLPKFKGIFKVIKNEIQRNGMRKVPSLKKKNGTKNKRVDCRGCMRKVSEVTEIDAATDANDELDAQKDLEKDMLDTLKRKRKIERITASEDVTGFLTLLDDIQAEELNSDAKAQWAYEVNMTEENKMRTLMTSLRLAQFQKTIWNIAKKFNLEDIRDPSVLRQMQMIQKIGNAALPNDKFAQPHKDQEQTRVSVPFTVDGSFLAPYGAPSTNSVSVDLTKISENSRDPEELKHVWLKWRDATGRRMKDMFVQYVELENEAARLNTGPRTFLHLVTDFPSAVDYWLQPYEEPNFRSHLEDLWAKIRPLYVQLHAYVRRKLRGVYGEVNVPRSGPIPAHLLGLYNTEQLN
uniref:Angiotensin-converting enzyme n=1 Tax=Timema shepardi TaxID=629360 RepID=A0A7R9G0Q1_TIMSH|nr:unnamed protein product [Timema shepardi]